MISPKICNDSKCPIICFLTVNLKVTCCNKTDIGNYGRLNFSDGDGCKEGKSNDWTLLILL